MNPNPGAPSEAAQLIREAQMVVVCGPAASGSRTAVAWACAGLLVMAQAFTPAHAQVQRVLYPQSAQLVVNPKLREKIQVNAEASAPIQVSPEASAPLQVNPKASAPLQVNPEASAPLQVNPEASAPLQVNPEASAPLQVNPKASAPLQVNPRARPKLQVNPKTHLEQQPKGVFANVGERIQARRHEASGTAPSEITVAQRRPRTP